MTLLTRRENLGSPATEAVFLTPKAEDLLADPASLVFLPAVVEWLSTINGRVNVIIPHSDSRLAYEDLPTSVATMVAMRQGQVQFLQIADNPEAATRDVALCLSKMDVGTARLVCGPETGGLLSAAAAMRHSGIAFANTRIALIPFGIESVQAERRCEFICEPRSVDIELLERDALRLADVVLVESQRQHDYVRRIEPKTPIENIHFPLPAELLGGPTSASSLGGDRLTFVGQLSSAGGLELLRGILQDFTRTNRRMHVTLAGCAGPAAYGDPFQFLVEAITDLKHDFEFVVSNDPSVLLDALDPSSVMMVAERLPLRTPMLDVLRARGLRVVDLTAGDWLESWQTNTGSLSSRFVVGRWAARKLCGVLNSQERPQQHANIAGTRAGTIGSTVSDVIARLEKNPAVGEGRWAFVFFNKDRKDFVVEQRSNGTRMEAFAVEQAGETFVLSSTKQIAATRHGSVADVVSMLLANLDQPLFAIFSHDVIPAIETWSWLAMLSPEVECVGMVLGDHQTAEAKPERLHPPRHLLQPLWHPKWRAPLALYSRTHLASILDDPCARKHAFSPFALWAISAALLTGFLVVPLPLSRQLPPLRREPAWAQLESLRRPLDHVIALADCKRVLPRDLARFIHGVHGWPSLQALTNLTSLLKLNSHDAVRSLQSAPSLNGAIWSSRLARLLAKVETTEGALVLLDKVRAAANGGKSDESINLRSQLQRRFETQLFGQDGEPKIGVIPSLPRPRSTAGWSAKPRRYSPTRISQWSPRPGSTK